VLRRRLTTQLGSDKIHHCLIDTVILTLDWHKIIKRKAIESFQLPLLYLVNSTKNISKRMQRLNIQ
jgi:hypothetical protein